VAAILEAAAQVFDARGLKGATTDRIAARAGVSVGSLYQYFGNKEGVLEALALRWIEESFDQLEASLARGGDDLAGRLLGAVVTLHLRRPRLHRIVFEEGRASPAARRRLRERQRRFVDRVADALGEGHPRPRRAAWLCVHAVEGCLFAHAADPRGDPATLLADLHALAAQILDARAPL